MRTVLMLLIMLSVAGRSSRAVYENIQINKRHECMEVPQSEYERCMEGVDKLYDEYEREPQEYLKERKRVANEQPSGE